MRVDKLRKTKRIISLLVCGLICLASAIAADEGMLVRIKDLAYIQGIRENQLTGLGLVTGLAGKGDSQENPMLRKTVGSLISTFGIEIPEKEVRSKNCALVMVTATVPAYARPGDRISVDVSSIGDSRSLEGGMLMQTQLKAANGNAYAVAQGIILPGTAKDRVETVASIPGGAIVEREVISKLEKTDIVSILLKNPDFTTADVMSLKIRESMENVQAKAVDASCVQVAVPDAYRENLVGFVSKIENLKIMPDYSGRVVIHKRSGVIVIGSNVKIGKVAVSYRGTEVSIGTRSAKNEGKNTFMLQDTARVEDLVTMFKEVGLKTDEIIEILRAIDRAGALYGSLEIM